jgi:hypothetical protein
MPLHPEYSSALRYQAGVQGYSYVYGAEYQYPRQSTHDYNVPCAVCYVSTRPTVVMIPAKASCPTTWTREYYGYIMSENMGHHRSMFECVDEDQESLRDSVGNTCFTTLKQTVTTAIFPAHRITPIKNLTV